MNSYNGTFPSIKTIFNRGSDARAVPHKLASSIKLKMPCVACQYVAAKVQGLIEKYSCDIMFQNQVNYLCEVTFGSNTPMTEQCSESFIQNCSVLETSIERGDFSTEYACNRLDVC